MYICLGICEEGCEQMRGIQTVMIGHRKHNISRLA